MTPDFLVLAQAGDASAGAVAAALAERCGAARVVHLTAGHLVQGRWRHGVAPDGAVQTLLAPPGGAVIDSRQVRGVLDRLLALPPLPRFARSSPKDRDYAAVEFQALLASWLAGFGPRLVNPAGPWTWLGGRQPRRAWMREAAAHGLPVPRDAHATAGRWLPEATASRGFVTGPVLPGLPASHDPLAGCGPPFGRVLVAGTFVGGSLAGTFGEACRQLGRSAGYRLVEFVFARIDGRPVLSDVDTVPALADVSEVEAVARLLAEIATDAGDFP